ncbi:hypothetical protein [Bradyrhizobium sp. SSUT77]
MPPANYQAFRETLERRNALVITGQSGTGKTWTALARATRRARRCWRRR